LDSSRPAAFGDFNTTFERVNHAEWDGSAQASRTDTIDGAAVAQAAAPSLKSYQDLQTAWGKPSPEIALAAPPLGVQSLNEMIPCK
jgi:hypothetical protein